MHDLPDLPPENNLWRVMAYRGPTIAWMESLIETRMQVVDFTSHR